MSSSWSYCTLAAVCLLPLSVSAQTGFIITPHSGVTAEGIVSTDSYYDHDATAVLNGYHSGIACASNQDCVLEVETEFAAQRYLDSESDIFLTAWQFTTTDPLNTSIGRVRVLLTQVLYNPAAGLYRWRISLRLNTGKTTTYWAQYGFSIYRAGANTKNHLTKNLTKNCVGLGGCSIPATQNTLNTAPEGYGFQGFMLRGFDVGTTTGVNSRLSAISVDGSINDFGTAEGGYTAGQNRKQGMQCSFRVTEPYPEMASCSVYTTAFASTGNHMGYMTETGRFANALNYNSASPSPNWWTYQSHATPYVPAAARFAGVFLPLRRFELRYTSSLPYTKDFGTGCASISFDSSTVPARANASVWGVISSVTSGNPVQNFFTSVDCFANWAQIGP